MQRKVPVLDELAGTSSCVNYKELQCVWNDPKAIIWLNLKDFAIEHHFVSPHFKYTPMSFAEVLMKALERHQFPSQDSEQ